MKDVFLDTVGLLAIWNKSDQWHTVAKAAFQKLLLRRARLVTTPLILWECGNAAARLPFRSQVVQLRRQLIQEQLLIEPSTTEIEAAWSSFERGDAGQAGIVDQVSIQVMRQKEISEIFSNDKHFKVAGFTLLF